MSNYDLYKKLDEAIENGDIDESEARETYEAEKDEYDEIF